MNSARNALPIPATILALALWSTSCLAQQPASGPGQPAALPGAVHAVTQALVQSGALACASRINQVASFLTAGSQHNSAFLFTPSVQPDQRMLAVSLEVAHPGTPLAYASASFAPNQGNGCGAEYETVVYWEKPCDGLATSQYAGVPVTGKLGEKTLVLSAGRARIFLMLAGKGCIAIKKELLD